MKAYHLAFKTNLWNGADEGLTYGYSTSIDNLKRRALESQQQAIHRKTPGAVENLEWIALEDNEGVVAFTTLERSQGFKIRVIEIEEAS